MLNNNKKSQVNIRTELRDLWMPMVWIIVGMILVGMNYFQY